MRASLLLFGLWLSAVVCYAQSEISQSDVVQNIIENQMISQGEETGEELYEFLMGLYSQPLDINKATTDQLRKLFILTELQVQSLVDYRNKYGRILTIYELQAIPHFDLPTIRNIIPFVTIQDTPLHEDNIGLPRRMISQSHGYALMKYQRTLQAKRGYHATNPNRYYGTADQWLTRVRIRHAHDFSIGFTADKDAGERHTLSKGNQHESDFYSFHFQLQNRNKIKNFVLGDYKIQFGQGLLLNAGFGLGKNAETVTTTKRSDLGIIPYTSTIESGYFRGAAFTYTPFKQWNITGFYSRTRKDATLIYDPQDSSRTIVKTIRSTGLHRTNHEINSRKQVIQETAGGNLLFNTRNRDFTLGLTFVMDALSKPVDQPRQPYRIYDFYGSKNLSASTSFSYRWQNINFFGEIAASHNGSMAMVAGLLGHLSPKIQTSLVLRNYKRDFHSMHGGGFGESGNTHNERGWYWGLKYRYSRQLTLSAYFDQFKFPWLKHQVSMPSTGYEYLARIEYLLSRSTRLHLQYKKEQQFDDYNNDEVIKRTLPGYRSSYILNLRQQADKRIYLNTRIQLSRFTFNASSTKGFALAQDINIDLRKIKLNGRYALFDTEDHANRQYIYEKDVLYGFSIPAYSGKGSRYYLVAQYKLGRKIDLWLRYANTLYRDRDHIGSGLEEIKGNRKSEVKVQARFKI